MDRDALVRAERRREALDALAFEEEREAQLVAQLEDVAAGADGDRVDTGVYAQMEPEQVALVRTALGQDGSPLPFDPDPELELDELGEAGEIETDDDEEDVEEELLRLQDELALARRTQAALRRYLDLLAEPGPV